MSSSGMVNNPVVNTSSEYLNVFSFMTAVILTYFEGGEQLVDGKVTSNRVQRKVTFVVSSS